MDDHVLYEMTMLAGSNDIGTIQPVAARIVKRGNRPAARSGDNPVHEDVYETWTNQENLGIGEKFRG